ncbi:MAG: helix-turn-helix domain-containing protein [Cytophagales bacterium]|nr:helix-turn-helix domain-containing protein [Cytophagales bacterium]
MTKAKIRFALASMKEADTGIQELCREMNISKTTLYRYVTKTGEITKEGKRVLDS